MLWLEAGMLLILGVVVLVAIIVSFNAAKKVHNDDTKKEVEMVGMLNIVALIFALGIVFMLYWYSPHEHVHVTFT